MHIPCQFESRRVKRPKPGAEDMTPTCKHSQRLWSPSKLGPKAPGAANCQPPHSTLPGQTVLGSGSYRKQAIEPRRHSQTATAPPKPAARYLRDCPIRGGALYALLPTTRCASPLVTDLPRKGQKPLGRSVLDRPNCFCPTQTRSFQAPRAAR